MPQDVRRESDDAEATQRLLKEEGEEDGDSIPLFALHGYDDALDGPLKELSAEEVVSHVREARLFSLKVAASLAVLALFAVLSLFAAYSSFAHNSTPTTAPSASSVRSEGYLLDPQWKFDAPPQRREYFWTITDERLNPDGVYRPMVVVNGQFPGPLVEVNEGDTVVVKVKNEGVNATSIHWHGLYQNGSNFMDGTVGVTQCPIAPGQSFIYEFTVSNQAGTYWYHSHMAAQASDGLYGPLVIHSKEEQKLRKTNYASDRIIMLSDHYYDLSGSLLYQYLKPDRENTEPVPAAALINGRGIRNCDDLPERECDNTTEGVSTPRLDLESGQNHRLRFINAGAFAEFQVQLDEHEFAVTEADGTDLVPRYYHRLNILPAQRYSIIVTTNHTDLKSYWLRARMVTHCFAEPNPELAPEIRAIVTYTDLGSKSDDTSPVPKSRDWPDVIELQCHDMNATELEPLIANPPPATADDQVYLRSNFEIGAWRLSRGFLNSSSWRANIASPSLQRFVDGSREHNISFLSPFSSFRPPSSPPSGRSVGSMTSSPSSPHAGINDHAFDPKTELVYQTHGIQTVDIVISNFDDGAHPFHLHGYKFWILASGKGYPPDHVSNLNFGQASSFPGTGGADAGFGTAVNLKNPLYRDTATVTAFGWVHLRFVADNAGMWAFHCHITWHAEAGLLMQFAVRTEEMKDWQVPDSMRDMCKKEGVERGKRPDDSIWYGDFGGG